MKILIADDNENTRTLIRNILEMHGHQVIETENGADTIHAFDLERPEVVLMDIDMPGMSGITATEKIREISPAARICIVTLLDDQFLRAAAIRAGAEKFLLKENLMELPQFLNE